MPSLRLSRAPGRLLLAATLLAAACGGAKRPAHLVERSRLAMGSTLRASVWTGDDAGAQAAIADAFAEFDRLERLLSVWIPGSDVVTLNAAAGDHPVPVDADTRAVLLAARQASAWTGGKFDITFGALADLWKFDHDEDDVIPDAAAIRISSHDTFFVTAISVMSSGRRPARRQADPEPGAFGP